jgi:3-hydroxybutyryl-CoA dehydrogenase
MASKESIFIVGESPLVEEYASLCHNKGFAVSVRLNPEHANVKLPAGISKGSAPSRGVRIALELTNTDLQTKESNLKALDTKLSTSCVILSSSVTVSVAEQEAWISKPDRLVGIGALPSMLRNDLIECTCSSASGRPAADAVKGFVARIGKQSAFVGDSVGMVLPRILAMLANEACFAIGEGVANGADIDTAMKLGTNYPLGPLEWAEKIGPRHVHSVVSALYRTFKEDRYRPSPFLTLSARRNSFSGV